MNDWRDELAERDVRVIERAEVDLSDLGVRWIALAGMVAAGGAPGDGARSVPGPRVPIRADVVDLQVEIARWTVRMVSLASGALRAGFSNVRSTVGGLGYLSSNISSIWREDPDTARDIADGAGRLRWRARRISGEVSSAFPIDVDCPECGEPALWAHPGRGLVRCGMPECGAEWMAADLAVAVWQSGACAQ